MEAPGCERARPLGRRPPRPPSACGAPPARGAAKAGAAERRPSRGRRPPALGLSLDSGPGSAFDISTPRGGGRSGGAPHCEEMSRHFIGTPTAGGILSAFLDFDDSDVSGPPLDPDYSALNAVGISGSMLDSDSGFECFKRGAGDDSVSSGGSTRFDMAGSDRCGDRSDGGSDCGEECGVFALDGDDDEDDGEEYDDDFEAESDAGSEDLGAFAYEPPPRAR